jgi:hypothetical protein
MHKHVERRQEERTLLKQRAQAREELEQTSAAWEREQMRTVLTAVRLNQIHPRA